MRLSFLRLALLALVCVLLLSGQYAMGDTPKPSDTGNQPATTAPAATTKPPSPPTTPPTPTTKPPTAAPQPSTPAPSTPNPSSSAPAASTPAPSTTAPATSEPSPTPEPSTEAVAAASTAPSPAPEATPATSSSNSESAGMGAGAIIGILLACVGLIGIVGFFAYRHFRARREDAENNEYDVQYGGASPVLESTRAHDDKMYSMMEMPKPSRQPTAATETPTDEIVIMTKYATPSSPKFAQNPPQLSPPPFQQEVADFTKSVNNFDKSQYSQQPPAAAASTEFATNSYRASYAESYAESYTGGGSFMNSYDQGGMMGRDTFRDTISSEQGENQAPAAITGGVKTATLDSAALEANNNQSHWMDAMDEMRDTQDSYAMLEAGGSFGSRGSAMRFSNESDIRG